MSYNIYRTDVIFIIVGDKRRRALISYFTGLRAILKIVKPTRKRAVVYEFRKYKYEY